MFLRIMIFVYALFCLAEAGVASVRYDGGYITGGPVKNGELITIEKAGLGNRLTSIEFYYNFGYAVDVKLTNGPIFVDCGCWQGNFDSNISLTLDDGRVLGSTDYHDEFYEVYGGQNTLSEYTKYRNFLQYQFSEALSAPSAMAEFSGDGFVTFAINTAFNFISKINYNVDSLETSAYLRDGTFIAVYNYETVAVPEPSVWITLIVGFGLLGASVRRRRLMLASD